ncbi:MAG: hypothetical protein V8R64_16690 [Thomasclavelia sp.]
MSIKNTYSLCGINSSTGEVIAQTKCAAEVKNILKFIKSAKERMSEENEVDILTGYEAGCLGFSLYHELPEFRSSYYTIIYAKSLSYMGFRTFFNVNILFFLCCVLLYFVV